MPKVPKKKLIPSRQQPSRIVSTREAVAKPVPPPARAVTTSEPPTLLFANAAAWEAYLETNGDDAPGVWLKIAKKGSPVPSVTYDEAIDVALCHGWIDGQRRALDETHFVQRFTPRRRQSLWSKRNVEKVAALTAAGRIRPRGQAEIDAARDDGRWDRAYAGSSTIEVPADFEEALGGSKRAKAFFATLSKGQRYPFLWRVETAKKPETRKKRIEQFVQLLAEGKTL
jgi:uncharacterized protein YdeI (YjbR/CyaY-like superfamily)